MRYLIEVVFIITCSEYVLPVRIDVFDERLFGVRKLLEFEKQFGQIQFQRRILVVHRRFLVVVDGLVVLMCFDISSAQFACQQRITWILSQGHFECVNRFIGLCVKA